VTLVSVNGRLVDETEAVVSVFDHGLTTGDGAFEGILVDNGRPFALRRHLDRLDRSVSLIGLPLPDRNQLTASIGAVVDSAGLERAKLRITVTAGAGPLGSARGNAPLTVIVAIEALPAARATAGGEGSPSKGTRVALSPWLRSGGGPGAGAKTISYVENVVALHWAHEIGANEALFTNSDGNLCEGTGSNVFVALDGELLTPPLSSGCLAGVTRGLVLELTDALERDVPASRLAEAEEAFLTSTTRGVLAIEAIGDRELPSCPGPLTAVAAKAYQELLATTPDP
jgi:branched-chain amino acid aminotransferase